MIFPEVFPSSETYLLFELPNINKSLPIDFADWQLNDKPNVLYIAQAA